MIITFYSFKGGVGRSMALANVAYALAQTNAKVCVIDWDLEAPGLHYFFGILDQDIKKGVIDIFYDYKRYLSNAQKNKKNKRPELPEYFTPLYRGEFKNITFVSAGLQNDDYSERVNNFDWKNFYKDWAGGAFIEWLRSELLLMFDYILIDSRTGITDIGGICTIQMPDVLVMLFAMNEQNLKGIKKVALNLQKISKENEYGLNRKPVFLPVPSRVEDRMERDLRDEWFGRGIEIMKEFLPEFIDHQEYFRQGYIPYIPQFSYGEKIVLLEKHTQIEDIQPAYKYLAKLLQTIKDPAMNGERVHQLGDSTNILISEINNAENNTDYLEKSSSLLLKFDKLSNDSDFNESVSAVLQLVDKNGVVDGEKFIFNNPLSDQNLKEFRWYIERSWQYRTREEASRIERIESSLRQHGQKLFNAVFEASPRAMGMYERLLAQRDKGKDCSIVINTQEPRILRLPWELLADTGGYLFSKAPPIYVHRQVQNYRKNKPRNFSLPVRVLVIISRPDSAGFFDPRSSAEPLLDALDALDGQAEVEFLRPPTLQALMHRVRDRKRPPVHVVHFDGHGVYDPVVGLGFLLFEKDDYTRDPVDAERLGSLLNECGIPLMFLDACQSGEPDEKNPFGSVAARLIESDVGGVVAMNYSVLVETSRRLCSHFYSALTRGESVNAALGVARLELLADDTRHRYYSYSEERNITVTLQDWFVPVLYQQGDELVLFPTSPYFRPDETSLTGTLAVKVIGQMNGFPPAPLHGFHGRARELLDLERAFARLGVVVLHGFGGQGKTSLASHAAAWFTRTGLFKRAVFLSFEHGASLEWVLNELGNAVVEENFQIYAGDKLEAITQALREHPTLLVFDNFESALPGSNAPMSELQALLDAAAVWFSDSYHPRNGHSALLLTTSNPNIPHPAFAPGRNCLHSELEGLAPSDALELASSILDAYSLPLPPRNALEKLLDFLKGHPLSLQLTLPQLRHYRAEKLMDQYQTLLPQMQTGEARERNDSLLVSLRFSLDRLGADIAHQLQHLAVFEGGAWEPTLLHITEILESDWQAIKPQLTATALIRAEELHGVTAPYIHFHPTLTPYLRAENENRELPIENRYWQVYYTLAKQLYHADSKTPFQARAIFLRELPNLKHAIRLALRADALDEAIDFADKINRFLDYFGRWRERDELVTWVEDSAQNRAQSPNHRIIQSEYILESGRGERLLQQGRVVDAERIFRALLARLEAEAEEWSYEITVTLGMLGRCIKAQGRLTQAVELYRRALALSQGLAQTNNLKRQTTAYHVDLADVLVDTGQYAGAHQEYQDGLKIVQEIGDNRSEGIVLGQLGTLALRQGDLAEARRRYLEALALFQRMGENQGQAIYWHQLGRVAEETRDWDEAERCYKESVTIEEKLGDLSGVAQTYNQLAFIAQNAGRHQEAERWYLRAIELKEKYSMPSDLASSLSNLADLYLSQNRLQEAETYARRALAIKETLDLSSGPWTTYSVLTQIAEKRKRPEEARQWWRKAQEARLAFEANSQADTSSSNIRQSADQWNDVVASVIKVCQSGQKDTKLEAFLDEMTDKDDWKGLAAVLRRILTGERGLELFDDLDDVNSAIVRRVLKGLLVTGSSQSVQTASPDSSPSDGDDQDGLTLPQLLDLVERAARGDRELGGQLFTAFQQMSKDNDSSMSALGNALLRVLVGDQNPDLSTLPDDAASAVRGLLGRLKH